MNFLSPGLVAGVLTLISAIATAAGYKPLGAFLSDPGTATTVNTVATGLLALVAGVLQGIRKPAA